MKKGNRLVRQTGGQKHKTVHIKNIKYILSDFTPMLRQTFKAGDGGGNKIKAIKKFISSDGATPDPSTFSADLPSITTNKIPVVEIFEV